MTRRRKVGAAAARRNEINCDGFYVLPPIICANRPFYLWNLITDSPA
jgi:hypothetical protein